MEAKVKRKNKIKKKKRAGRAHKFEMPKWMECGWRRVGCGKDSCPLCGRLKRDRLSHLEKNEDPNSLKSALEDVGRNFKEALSAIKADAKRHGIEISSINNIKEPPEPEEFSLYRKVDEWRRVVHAIIQEANDSGELWLMTEAGQDLSWYSSLLGGKTYRQLSNRWEMANGDQYGEFDYKYTKKVIKEASRIMREAMIELISYDTHQQINLMQAQREWVELEKEALKI